jgi:hypothetical protein
LLPLHGEVSASCKTHRLAARRSIKRFGNGCSPVDHHWLARYVGYCQTANVKTLDFIRVVYLAINSAEDQGGIAQVKMCEALQQLFIK